ncbi:MAG: hypothetical protein N3F07_02760 [Candidatus Micrarchaeota archaeon]|nr:hypothetical protein [Candidatus Micrarchaeota archaeon]
MPALEFNEAYHSLLVFFLAAIPGIAIGWPLLRKSGFSRMEKFLLSFFIGLVAVPSLLYAQSMVGIKFSLALVLIDFFAVVAAGLFWGIKTGVFKLQAPKVEIEEILSLETLKTHAASFFLLFCILLAFWIRIQTYSPIYSELDPYFYVYATSQIIQEGAVPFSDDTAWWPEERSSHRGQELRAYIEAQWYAAYTGGGAYNNHLLYTIACWLPPISGAMAAFGAYLAVSSVFGRRYGLLAAFLMCFLPISIFKTAAGVNETAPFGLMTIFLFLGTYAYALVKNESEASIIAAISAFATATGSNYSSLISIPFGLFVALQSADYYLRMKKPGSLVQLSLYPFAGFVVGLAMKNISLLGLAEGAAAIFSGSSLIAIFGFLFAFGLEAASDKMLLEKKKRVAIFALSIIAVLVFLLVTPPGQFPKNIVSAYLGTAQFNYPLDRTIAEQNQAGSSFEGESGFIGIVPKNHISRQADAWGIISNALYSLLGIVADIFTAIGNAGLSFADAFFNSVFGMNISTGEKDSSLLFFFLTVFFAGSIAWHFARKGESREIPSVLIFILLFASPVMYVGMNKVKYTIFAGVMLVLAASISLGLLEMAFKKAAARFRLPQGDRVIDWSFAAIVVLLVFAQMTVSNGYLLPLLSKSFETRYQDDPIGRMPKLASLCEELRQKGYYDAEICAAGYDKNFSEDLNQQFSYKICIASQLSVEEILPGPSQSEQEKSLRARIGASYRCNRLADYWVESMEWISKNVEADARITSWWDYGHWINYHGERKTVLRNEHTSRYMIGRIAHDFLDGTPEELRETMKRFGSRYVLFDVELIGGLGSQFGGKYGALNYLSCAYENKTSVKSLPGTSDCEFEHSPERLIIPQVASKEVACVISESQRKEGVYAYRVGKSNVFDKPTYCVGDAIIRGGETITGLYYLDRKDEDGNLRLAKGTLRKIGEEGGAIFVEVVYDDLPIWPGPNGTWVGGMEDASTKFYTSNLYRGMFLNDLPGFDLVFSSKNGEVKIYRMEDSLWNGIRTG